MTEIHLDEYQTRKEKLKNMQEAWIIPYANKYTRTHTIAQLRSSVIENTLPAAETLMTNGAKSVYSIAWRMMLFRTMGKLSFAQLRDGNDDIQIAFVNTLCSLNTWKEKVNSISIGWSELSAYKFVEKMLDWWDFIGVQWELFITKHGELTLFVNEFQLLSKSLRPLWDKWHWINDIEKRYRQRYLDMTMNPESYERMKLRSTFIKTLRQFYRKNDFIELDTPILWNSASWAAATPFVTRHEDFDTDMYLRIAPEIALKMATAWRFEKVFEIWKDFRNEWSSPSHHQEFLVAEHYAAYRNYEDNMRFTEAMFEYFFENIKELNKIVTVVDKEWIGREVNFSTPWEKIDYTAQVLKDSWIDVSTYTAEDEEIVRAEILKQWFHREWIENQGTATMIDYLYKKVTRPKIVGPAFIYNYPKTMQPLARQSDTNPNIVEQFQVIVNGREILKAYSELVNPVIQQANFDEQSAAAKSWDSEATKSDDAFVLAMEYGMPPQSWWWMGLDRILTMLTEQHNIRDVIMFPMMKEENSEELKHEHVKITEVMKTEHDYVVWLPNELQTNQLIDTYLTETKRHCLQVGHVMQCFARELGQDEHYWWTAWVLHDIDRDHIAKDSTKHLKDEFETIMNTINAPEQLIKDIQSHWPQLTWVEPDTLLRKYLIAVDELSGLLYAYSLMRPTWFDWMEMKWALKRIKDKTFAAGVDREHVRNCEIYLNIPLEVFIPQIIAHLSTFEKEV
jgi:lysyl-tRNA synthetase, class II